MSLQECGLKLDYAQRELQPHGTREFPCAGYGAHYTDSEEDAVPWHWHEELELVCVESGALRVRIPGKTFHLGPGDGFAVNSNILHTAVAEPACKAYSLVFSPILVAGSRESVFSGKYMAPLARCAAFDGYLWERSSAEGNVFTGRFMGAFEALSEDRPGYEFTVREKLSAICLMLYRAYEGEMGADNGPPDQDSVRLRRMLDQIHNHFAEDLQLRQIAKAADIGERECLRCFRRVMQTSPIQYLLKYRATQGASMLLRDRSSSVSEIAGRCGFDSPSHFSQTFKRFYRYTPRDYRIKQEKNRDLP